MRPGLNGDTSLCGQDLKRSLASLKRRIVKLRAQPWNWFDKMNCCGAGLN